MLGKNIAKALGPRVRFLVLGVEGLGELSKWGCTDQQAFVVTLMSLREKSVSPRFRERKKTEGKKGRKM